jgi:signal transduction histidine kinase
MENDREISIRRSTKIRFPHYGWRTNFFRLFVAKSWLLRLTVLELVAILSGCSSQQIDSRPVAPTIRFSSVPLAGRDNPDKLSTIKGRVLGAKSGQVIVLYARGKTTWWVQPFADNPFTEIQSNSTWSSSTHPGAEYAALLVGPGFRPPPTTDVLPTEGVFAVTVTRGALPFRQRWWFYPVWALAGALVIFGLYRLRLHSLTRKLNMRFEERLAERAQVAQELHDTLLQGVLSASMQLHVVVDGLPQDASVRPALNRVLQMMGQVIDEGRNTLRGLRSSIESGHDLKDALSQIPLELGQTAANFRVVVEGKSLPLRPEIRDDVYRIGREALINAFRHSGARNVDLRLEYGATRLKLVVLDDGCGIAPGVIEQRRDERWGIWGMRERAERMGAKLRILSRAGGGTEVELRIPRQIAFGSEPSGPAIKWLTRLQSGQKETETASK